MQWLDIEANPSPKYKEKTLNTKAISNPEALPIQPNFCIQMTSSSNLFHNKWNQLGTFKQ